MDKYGVAFSDGWHNMKHNLNAYPQVTTCLTKESAIEVAKNMKKYICGDIVAFENLGERTEVNWRYILDHEIS